MRFYLPEEDLEQIADQADDSLRDLTGARLFITGGTGFFGIWLVEALVWACEIHGLNLDVTVLSRNPEAFCERFPHLAGSSRVKFVAGDVRTFAYPDRYSDFVIHGAAGVHAGTMSDPLASSEAMIDGSRRVLGFAHTSGVRSVLLLSSGAVYGPQRVNRVSEERMGSLDPMRQSSAYGLSKLMSEHIAALWHQEFGLPVKIARCFAFLGPGMPLDGQFAAGNFFRGAIRGGPIEILGHRDTVRSYLYPSDLVAWLLAILVRGAVCRPYNVGSEDEITIEALARLISDASPEHPPVVLREGAAGQPSRYVPSTARIRQELACRQTIVLKDAVARTHAWFRTGGAALA